MDYTSSLPYFFCVFPMWLFFISAFKCTLKIRLYHISSWCLLYHSQVIIINFASTYAISQVCFSLFFCSRRELLIVSARPHVSSCHQPPLSEHWTKLSQLSLLLAFTRRWTDRYSNNILCIFSQNVFGCKQRFMSTNSVVQLSYSVLLVLLVMVSVWLFYIRGQEQLLCPITYWCIQLD